LFHYRAQNAQGWGDYSDTMSLIAARRPDQVAPVITSNEETLVQITWSEPTYDGGSPLLAYRIYIQTESSDYVEQTEYCNGDDIQVRADIFC
jgi:hypothetical protein